MVCKTLIVSGGILSRSSLPVFENQNGDVVKNSEEEEFTQVLSVWLLTGRRSSVQVRTIFSSQIRAFQLGFLEEFQERTWMAGCPSFLWLNVPLHIYATFYLLICQRTLRLFLGYYEWCCSEHGNAESLQDTHFVSFTYPEVGLLNHIRALFFTFFRNTHTFYHSGCNNLHSQQRNTRVLLSPHISNITLYT